MTRADTFRRRQHLRDRHGITGRQSTVCHARRGNSLMHTGEVNLCNANQDNPPPWLPAVTQHTTSGSSDRAELHMVRAVDTGVVNVS